MRLNVETDQNDFRIVGFIRKRGRPTNLSRSELEARDMRILLIEFF